MFEQILTSAVFWTTAVPIALLVIYIISAIRFVDQWDRLVVLRLGNYAGTRGPGVTVVFPFFERAIAVSTREVLRDIPAQTAITQDNASILIDFLVYYQITDPAASVLEVEDVHVATTSIATTTLRAVIGDIDLDGVLSKREQINGILRVKLDEATERWGIKVTAVEIREIEPPREILDAMNRQMSAERQRRAEVTRANGDRESAIARAEGEKQSSILRAEGDRQAKILAAQAEREAQLLQAEGYAQALEAIYKAAQHIDEKTMALQYMEMLEQIGKSESTKFVLPMELTSFVQNMAGMAGLGAAMQPQPSRDPQPLPNRTGNGSGD